MTVCIFAHEFKYQSSSSFCCCLITVQSKDKLKFGVLSQKVCSCLSSQTDVHLQRFLLINPFYVARSKAVGEKLSFFAQKHFIFFILFYVVCWFANICEYKILPSQKSSSCILSSDNFVQLLFTSKYEGFYHTNNILFEPIVENRFIRHARFALHITSQSNGFSKSLIQILLVEDQTSMFKVPKLNSKIINERHKIE